MPKLTLTFSRDFSRFNKVLKKKRTREIVQRHMGRAMARAAVVMQAGVRQEFKKIKPKNAALTIALKGGNGPLVGKTPPTLFGAVTTSLVAWNHAFVGVLRTNGNFNVAEFVHDGGAIPVTQQMRNLFFVLWAASVAQERGHTTPYPLYGRAAVLFELYDRWERLRPSTTVIRVPRRPFIANALKRKRVRKRIQKEWELGIAATLKELAGK